MSMRKTAEISPCGTYRTVLTRHWDSSLPPLAFLLLNPSTADAEKDDPTIRRCIGFARREGAGGIVVGNVYSYRVTNPALLPYVADPFGPDNTADLLSIAWSSVLTGKPLVCGWGAYVIDEDVLHTLVEIVRTTRVRTVCLGTTKRGCPRHPLYVRADQPLIPFDIENYARPAQAGVRQDA